MRFRLSPFELLNMCYVWEEEGTEYLENRKWLRLLVFTIVDSFPFAWKFPNIPWSLCWGHNLPVNCEQKWITSLMSSFVFSKLSLPLLWPMPKHHKMQHHQILKCLSAQVPQNACRGETSVNPSQICIRVRSDIYCCAKPVRFGVNDFF